MFELKIKPDIPFEMDDTDNPAFDEWMQRVDHVLERCIGITSNDLPDCCYKDWYEERMRPVYAANEAVKLAQEF